VENNGKNSGDSGLLSKDDFGRVSRLGNGVLSVLAQRHDFTGELADCPPRNTAVEGKA
jgi:hypothetical protein